MGRKANKSDYLIGRQESKSLRFHFDLIIIKISAKSSFDRKRI